MRDKQCQWGIQLGFGQRCPAVAVTRRVTAMGHTQDVCQEHADFYDRLERNIKEHEHIFRRLEDL